MHPETSAPFETASPEKAAEVFSKPAFSKKPAFAFPAIGKTGSGKIRLSRKEKIFFLDAF